MLVKCAMKLDLLLLMFFYVIFMMSSNILSYLFFRQADRHIPLFSTLILTTFLVSDAGGWSWTRIFLSVGWHIAIVVLVRGETTITIATAATQIILKRRIKRKPASSVPGLIYINIYSYFIQNS